MTTSSSILARQKDREHAARLRWIGSIFRVAFQAFVVVVDFPHHVMAGDLEAAVIVLATGVVLLAELRKRSDLLKDACLHIARQSVDPNGVQHVAPSDGGA